MGCINNIYGGEGRAVRFEFRPQLNSSPRITLAGGPLQITSNIMVNGTGQTIDGNNASPLLYIDPTTTTSLSYLTLTGGNSGPAFVSGGVRLVPGAGGRLSRLPQAWTVLGDTGE